MGDLRFFTLAHLHARRTAQGWGQAGVECVPQHTQLIVLANVHTAQSGYVEQQPGTLRAAACEAGGLPSPTVSTTFQLGQQYALHTQSSPSPSVSTTSGACVAYRCGSEVLLASSSVDTASLVEVLRSGLPARGMLRPDSRQMLNCGCGLEGGADRQAGTGTPASSRSGLQPHLSLQPSRLLLSRSSLPAAALQPACRPPPAAHLLV